MIADKAAITAARTRFPPDKRLILLYGPDTTASLDLAGGITLTHADPADPLSIQRLAGAELAQDPSALVAAASAVSLFGASGLIRVDDATDDAAAAVGALLASDRAGLPVVMTAGALRKGGKLLGVVERAPAALMFISYLPDARGMLGLVAELAGEVGLRPTAPASRLLIEATGGDRAVLRRELEKLALYVDASVAAPQPLTPADVGAVGAGSGDGDLGVLVEALAGGDAARLDRQLQELTLQGVAGIAMLRATLRRFWLLLELRRVVDGGGSAASAVDGARPPVFWKDKPALVAQLAEWSSPAVRGTLARLLATERAVKSSGTAGDVLVRQLMLALVARGRGDAVRRQ